MIRYRPIRSRGQLKRARRRSSSENSAIPCKRQRQDWEWSVSVELWRLLTTGVLYFARAHNALPRHMYPISLECVRWQRRFKSVSKAHIHERGGVSHWLTSSDSSSDGGTEATCFGDDTPLHRQVQCVRQTLHQPVRLGEIAIQAQYWYVRDQFYKDCSIFSFVAAANKCLYTAIDNPSDKIRRRPTKNSWLRWNKALRSQSKPGLRVSLA